MAENKPIYIDYDHNPKSGFTISTGSAKTGIDWEQVGNIKTEATAKRIVHRYNHFDEVVKQLERAMNVIRDEYPNNQPYEHYGYGAMEQALKNAQQDG